MISTRKHVDLETLGSQVVKLKNCILWVHTPQEWATPTMIGENQQLVTDEPVEFEKSLVEVEDYRKFTDHSREIYIVYPNSIKEIWRMSTCNRLDL